MNFKNVFLLCDIKAVCLKTISFLVSFHDLKCIHTHIFQGIPFGLII